MVVEKAFWEDSYRTELATTITGAHGSDVTLERTIFYAFSGGQEGDTGTIGGYPVREARKEGREIVYTIEVPHDLKAGDAVIVRIDWLRRYSLMRLHFAAEIVLELMYQKYPETRKVGAHISEKKARLDFAWEGNISETFPVIEEGFRGIVSADHAITSAFEDPEGEVRYWEIHGFARVPCGGTHLKRTGEVGTVTLRRNNIGKGKERIEIFLPA